MAITYTESWAQQFTDDLNEREVTITLHVVSDSAVLNSSNYKGATEATSGLPFPSKGDFWTTDTRYRVHRLSAPEFDGPRYAKVAVVYRTGPFGGSETEDDPLAVPVRYRWRPLTQSEPTDTAYDTQGNLTVPIINSAGDPFSSPVQGFYNAYSAEAYRNEASYDPTFGVSFQNTVNQDSFTFAGKTINAGEALCTGIFPASEYTLEQEYVTVAYQFLILERLTLSGGGRVTAHSHRILDQGRRGWIYDDRKVAIHDRNGDQPNPTPVSSDVPLDEGVPIGEPGDEGKSFWSVAPNFEPADGRGWVKSTKVATPPLLAIDKTNDPNNPVTWLYYRKFPETDFSGLNL